jgi:glutaredoxin
MASTTPFSTYSAKDLLETTGYEAAPPEGDETPAHHGVETSPLLFIDDEPIGGYDDLKRWLARNAH